ncbi:MAG: hypothetical protein K8F24_03140, partial [Bacteroidales bacterium]|nr:hypothetical protein [Bacteroidales bacterium]
YDEGESAASNSANIATKGVGTANGFVYDALTNMAIEGASVRVQGPAGNYVVPTGVNGAYSTLAYAGTYDNIVSANGYNTANIVGVIVTHNTTTSNNFYLGEVPYPVAEVTAFELSDDAVQISWDGQGEPVIEEWLVYEDDVQRYGGIGAQAADYSLTWASKWTPTQLIDYSPGYVTKVAVYQMASVGDYLTEVRILAGENGETVLYTQDVTGEMIGDSWNIIALDDAVEFDNAENLWIAMYVQRPGGTFNEPLAWALESIANRYDYFAYNGGAWTTALGQYGIANAAWMLRGYVTTDGGAERMLGAFTFDPSEYKDYSKAPAQPTGLGMIKSTVENTKFPKFADNNTRGLIDYTVLREKVYQGEPMVAIGNTSQQNFVDFDWGIMDWGVYRWAVRVNYDAGQVSDPTYSNTIDKNMEVAVDVTVSLNSNESPGGTSVTFTNISEPGLELVYDVVLDNSGFFIWNDFRRGKYDIEVMLPGYGIVQEMGVEIFDDASFAWLLEEMLTKPSNLYVTPTAFASWDIGGGGGSFVPVFADFNNGMPADWTVEFGPNANSAHNWYIETPAGNPQTAGASLDGTPFAYIDSDEAGSGNWLDGYLVSPVVDASGVTSLYLEFDQYYNYISSGEYAAIEVYDGSAWVEVLRQVEDHGSWANA